jgi:hypothetical protein
MHASQHNVPPLVIADAVRPQHANTFAQEWFRHSWETRALGDALTATNLVEWPYSYSVKVGVTPEQVRYRDIEREILERTLEAILPVVQAAFAQAATDVLDRERDRQR